MNLISKTLTLLLFCPLSLSAGIILPEIIGDNMVVQQTSDVRLWGWAEPGEKISVSASWDPETTVSTNADKATGKWVIEIPSPEASFNRHNISISGKEENIVINNVLVGEVWFCSGQSNMEMPLRGFWTQPVEGAVEAIAFSGSYPEIRFAKIPKTEAYTPQEKVSGAWMVSCPKNAYDFSALAYFFARALQQIINVPIGIIDCSYGGSKVEGWQSEKSVSGYPEFNIEKEKADKDMNNYERATVMFNAMLNPIAGYNVRGFLWNQGESNVGRHATYPTHLSDMVKEWRNLWNLGDLPFYFVEIPGWNYGDPDGTDAALFRECQHEASKLISNSGIVSTSDLVYPFEVNDIHARKKKEIGQRLAFMAAGKTYGIEGMPIDYPTFKSMKIEGDKAILSFDNAYSGFTPNVNLEGFEAAGEDGIFHDVTAVENPQTLNIEIQSDKIKDIKHIRYNFRNFRIGKVFNVLGLPLIPFRTDRDRTGD